MRRKVLCLVAMLLCFSLVIGNGSIATAAEVLYATAKAEDENETIEEDGSEEIDENISSEDSEESEDKSEEEEIEVISEESTEDEEDITEESAEDVSEENKEEESEETSEEVSKDTVDENSEENSEEFLETETTFKYEGYEIDFLVTSQWENGYTVNMVIRNIGIETIHNWTVLFEGNFVISNIWNAEVVSEESEQILLGNIGWNQDIYPNQELTIGFTSDEAYKGLPKKCTLIDKAESIISDGYEIIFEKTDLWSTGYTGKITINNTSDIDIEDWRLAFELEDEIVSVWDAQLLEKDMPYYLVSCPDYNQNIKAGESISFGLNASGMNPDSTIKNVSLSQFLESEVVEEEEYVPTRELEPLQSIGEAYYKDATEEDVILNEDTGILYVKNQILISGVPGEPKELYENLATDLGAEIVGYLEITNDYQLEFNTYKSAEELDTIIEKVKNYSFVSYASLNVASYVTTDAISNDELYCDGRTTMSSVVGKLGDSSTFITEYDETKPDEWDEDNADGDNWGLEALKVPSAWEYKEYFESVKVGIIDSYFYEKHEDLIFDDIKNKTPITLGTHGMGVAGVIAAQHNNETGISGVATDVRLYGFDFKGNKVASSMKNKTACAELICNGVKVINISWGYSDIGLVYGASRGNENAIKYISEDAYTMGEYLNKLLKLGYDFVIVNSAGNFDNKWCVKDDVTYGYRAYAEGDDIDLAEREGTFAHYGGVFRAINKNDFSNVYDRIVVVGALQHSVFDMTRYYISDYSNIGERVDVVAPADDIIWTVPYSFSPTGYMVKSSGGTSTATPHVTGIIALMYQINPGLAGDKAKRILCESYSLQIVDYDYVKKGGSYYSYKLPDAEKCVRKAFASYGNPYVISGTLTGVVIDDKGNPIEGAKICATPVDWYEDTLRNEQTIVNTDADGLFMMKLEEQSYELSVCADGFVPHTYDERYFVGPDAITDAGAIILSARNEKVKPEECNIVGMLGASTTVGTVSASGFTVHLRAGWNNTTGDYLTDDLGNEYVCKMKSYIFFSNIPYGEYTAEVKADGYKTTYLNMVSTLRRMPVNEYIISPDWDENIYTIELTYVSETEIDCVALYYEEDKLIARDHGYLEDENIQIMEKHIYFNNPKYQREIVFLLNTDKLLGRGGVYEYFLYAYDDCGSNQLSRSQATVRLYRGNKLCETCVISGGMDGNVWHVLTLDQDGWHMEDNLYTEESIDDIK